MKKKRLGKMWEMPQVIKISKPALNGHIICENGSSKACENPKKCNKKNACNESLKPFF
jgi:hypothetical protein